jgi:hypothetical protein
MADGSATANIDGSAKALRAFTQGDHERFRSRSLYGKVVLLDDGCPYGANIGIPTQDRDQVALTGPPVVHLPNEPIHSKPDSRSGVLHSLRVFQNAEAFMGILHDGFFLLDWWDLTAAGENKFG